MLGNAIANTICCILMSLMSIGAGTRGAWGATALSV